MPDPAYRGLRGGRAAVTGGASGIGRATVELLRAMGARVTVADRDAAALAAMAAVDPELATAEVDVTDEAAVAAWVGGVVDAWGGIDFAVHSAGIELFDQDAAVDRLSEPAWQRTIQTNLGGSFHVAKHLIPALRRGVTPSLVFVGSPTGIYGMELGAHAYSASKGGIHGLMRVMANEYAPEGIRVNAVLPGFVETPMNRPVLDDESARAAVLRSIPLGRAAHAREIAPMICFLLSDDAAYCTGGLYTVDGGLTAV